MATIGFVVSLSFIGLGYASTYMAVALLFVFYCFRGLATPILKNYINDNTGSDVRATVLSVRMFLVYVIFAALFPLMGWVGDASSWSAALMVAGFLFACFTSVAVLCLYFSQRPQRPTVD